MDVELLYLLIDGLVLNMYGSGGSGNVILAAKIDEIQQTLVKRQVLSRSII